MSARRATARAALAASALLAGACGPAGEHADAGPTPDAGPLPGCTTADLEDPPTAVTYYIAVGEPGADNDACDGLAPTDEGGGHCPFRDFASPRTSSLLDGASGVRVALRAGTYVISNFDGLLVRGTGNSDSERAVLSSYQGEAVTLDTAIPDGAGCVASPPPDGCVRQVVRVAGDYTAVQGLTIQNGLGYDLEVNGGAHHLVRCNRFRDTVTFAMRSDLVKLDGDASDVQVLENELTGWSSQAIDMTQVRNVLVEGNDFHDPLDPTSGATGSKFGAQDVTIRGNRVHDIPGTGVMFSLGGTGSPHPDDYEAYRIQVVDNDVSGVGGKVAQLVSCQDCVFSDNHVSGAGGGVLLSAAGTGAADCSAAAGGCHASTGARITGNSLRGLDGAGEPAAANIFVYAQGGEGEGLVGDLNVYCAAPSASDAQFGWIDMLVPFEDWILLSGTDQTSQVLDDTDPACRW